MTFHDIGRIWWVIWKQVFGGLTKTSFCDKISLQAFSGNKKVAFPNAPASKFDHLEPKTRLRSLSLRKTKFSLRIRKKSLCEGIFLYYVRFKM